MIKNRNLTNLTLSGDSKNKVKSYEFPVDPLKNRTKPANEYLRNFLGYNDKGKKKLEK